MTRRGAAFCADLTTAFVSGSGTSESLASGYMALRPSIQGLFLTFIPHTHRNRASLAGLLSLDLPIAYLDAAV